MVKKLKAGIIKIRFWYVSYCAEIQKESVNYSKYRSRIRKGDFNFQKNYFNLKIYKTIKKCL